MFAEEIVVNCYNFNPVMVIKSKKVIFKVSNKTVRSRSRSRNSDLRLHGSRAEKNTCALEAHIMHRRRILCTLQFPLDF